MKMKSLITLTVFLFLGALSNAKSVEIPASSALREDVKVKLPRGFKKKEKWPLILSMHGYGGNSFIQKYYVRLGHFENQYGFVYAAPNGIKNNEGKRFWNASNFCCDFDETEVDDVAYIKELIQNIKDHPEIGRIDLNQIYLIGYSNGAFLASKIACESDLKIAGIVTISGTGDLRDDDQNLISPSFFECSHDRPVKVLHVHGTKDETIRYEGFDNGKTAHVSALDQTKRWANHNGCSEEVVKSHKTLNASNFLKGDDTEVYSFTGCREKVQHFKILDGVHFAVFKKKFTKAMLDFLFN